MSNVNVTKFNIIFLVFSFISITAVCAYVIQRTLSTRVQTKTQSQVASVPTPMPAYELTIPYLRSRSYISRLSSLTKVTEFASYTSYTTSYSSDGLKINALITKPVGKIPLGGWPGVVFVHGYIPPKTYQTLGQAYFSYVDYLAKNGFVVLKIDLRGHGDSEGEARGGYYSSDYVVDVLHAYVSLQSADFVNPSRIGLWGHSMAGNVLLRAFAVRPDIPAVVIWAGAGYTYVDLLEYGLRDTSYQSQARSSNATESGRQRANQVRQMYGDPRNGNPFWKLVSATNYLNDLNGAIQLNHSIDDQVVSIEYSRNLKKLLNDTSVVHELNEFQSGGHNISDGNFVIAMQKTVEFFNKYLRGN